MVKVEDIKLDPDMLGEHNRFKKMMEEYGISKEDVDLCYKHMQEGKLAAFDAIKEHANEAPEHLRPLIKFLILDCFTNKVPGFEMMIMSAILVAVIGSKKRERANAKG